METTPRMIRQLRIRLSAISQPDLVFWVCFLALNLLLFLPLYLLNRQTTTFLPHPLPPVSAPADFFKGLALRRENLDPFRLNSEITLLVALWVFVRWTRGPRRHRSFSWFLVAVYFVVLIYYLYESIVLSLYQVEPVFYSQYRLFIEGIPFALRNLNVPFGFYIVAALALTVAAILIGTLIRTMIGNTVVGRLSLWSRAGLASITLLVLISGFKYQETLARPEMVVSSFVYKLQKNISDSVQARRSVLAFDNMSPHYTYDYSGYDLVRKPNIYLIFVESYGSVLYKRPDYRQAYTSLLSQLERQLRDGGWHAASTLSEAPTWGGGSWMSYTSALFGLRIDSHPEYLSLIDGYQSDVYPDLGHYLKTQGYEYARFSSLSDEMEEEEWLRYKNFYGVDRWLQYGDLDYEGPHYGWGPSPPDQYALHFAHQAIVSGSDRPIFLFTITQNSHYPWVPLPEVADDWRTLNQETTQEAVPLPDPIPHQVRRKNYLKSIDYELGFLTDFILKKGDANSIFVLIGDHQPQRVSRRSDGFDTPIHVISQDAAFVDGFLDYDFVRGLTVQDHTPTMRHEGFYSMFVQALLAQYGRGAKALPAYRPDGIALEAGLNGDEF